MKRIIYSFVAVCLLLSSCSMDETPQASVDKDTVFRTEKGLETYSYSFYNMLPSVSDGFRQDAMCDYGAVTKMCIRDRSVKGLTNGLDACIFALWFFHNSIRFKVNKVG